MREVRVIDAFFDDVDAQFRPERGPSGEPSADDFIRHSLPLLINKISERFDSAADLAGAPGIRAFVLPDVLIPSVVIYAGEKPDGVVYLVALEVDTDPLASP